MLLRNLLIAAVSCGLCLSSAACVSPRPDPAATQEPSSISASARSSPRPDPVAPKQPSVIPISAPLATFDPSHECAGINVAGVRVSIADGIVRGSVVDPHQPETTLTDTVYVLAWPAGYRLITTVEGTVVQTPAGRTVARNGTVFVDAPVCIEDTMMLVELDPSS